MSLSRAHQVFAAELKNYFPRAHGPHDTCVYICNCVAGDFEREQLVLRVTIVLAEFLKIIGYLTINIGQTHLRSYTLLAASAAAVTNMAGRCTVASFDGSHRLSFRRPQDRGTHCSLVLLCGECQTHRDAHTEIGANLGIAARNARLNLHHDSITGIHRDRVMSQKCANRLQEQ
jgi:hypothetical protein